MPDHQFVDVLRTMVGVVAPALLAGAEPTVTLRLGDATTTLSPSATAEAGSILTGSGTVEIVLSGPEVSLVPARDVTIAVLTCDHDRLVEAVVARLREGPYDVVQRYTSLSLAGVSTHVEPSAEPGSGGAVVTCRLTVRTKSRIEIRRVRQEVPDGVVIVG